MKLATRPEKIGDLLQGYLSDAGLLAICKENDIIRRWPEIVGERVAEVAVCDRAEDGVLYVRVASAAWRQELSYLKHRIMSKITHQTGCDSIREIVFY